MKKCTFFNRGNAGRDFSKLVVRLPGTEGRTMVAFAVSRRNIEGSSVLLDQEQWEHLKKVVDKGFEGEASTKWECS